MSISRRDFLLNSSLSVGLPLVEFPIWGLLPDTLEVAWERARNLGKPLMVFEFSKNPDSRWGQGGLYAELLQLAPDPVLSLLALCELACERVDRLDKFTGALARVGEGQLTLLETTGPRSQGRGVQWPMGGPAVPANFEGGIVPGHWPAHRLNRLGKVIAQTVGDPNNRARESLIAEIGGAERILDALRYGQRVTTEQVDRNAAALLALAERSGSDRILIERLVTETLKIRVLRQGITGARWVQPSIYASPLVPGPSGGLPFLVLDEDPDPTSVPPRHTPHGEDDIQMGARLQLGSTDLRHRWSVAAMAASPAGRFASAGRDGVRIWEGHHPVGHDPTAAAGVCWRRGGWLSAARTLRLLDQDGSLEQEHPLQEQARGVAWLPRCALIITTDTLEIRSLKTGEVMTTLSFPERPAAVDGQRDRWAVSGWKGTVMVYTRQGAELLQRSGGTTALTAVSLSPDGHAIAASGSSTHLWDLKTGEKLWKGPGGDALAWHGETLIVGSRYGSIFILNRHTGETISRWRDTALAVSSLAAGPDGSVLSGDRDGSLRLWDSAGVLRAAASGHHRAITAISWRADALPGLATAGQRIGAWSLDDGTLRRLLKGHNRVTRDLHWHDFYLVSAGADGIRVWEMRVGGQRAHLEAGWSATTVRIHNHNIYAGGADGQLLRFDLRTLEKVELGVLPSKVCTIDVGPPGVLIACESGTVLHTDEGLSVLRPVDGLLGAWWLPSGYQVEHRRDGVRCDGDIELGEAGCVAVSPDGRIALGTTTIRILDRSGELLESFDGHPDGITALSFSADGSELASGGESGVVRLWPTGIQ